MVPTSIRHVCCWLTSAVFKICFGISAWKKKKITRHWKTTYCTSIPINGTNIQPFLNSFILAMLYLCQGSFLNKVRYTTLRAEEESDALGDKKAESGEML